MTGRARPSGDHHLLVVVPGLARCSTGDGADGTATRNASVIGREETNQLKSRVLLPITDVRAAATTGTDESNGDGVVAVLEVVERDLADGAGLDRLRVRVARRRAGLSHGADRDLRRPASPGTNTRTAGRSTPYALAGLRGLELGERGDGHPRRSPARGTARPSSRRARRLAGRSPARSSAAARRATWPPVAWHVDDRRGHRRCEAGERDRPSARRPGRRSRSAPGASDRPGLREDREVDGRVDRGRVGQQHEAGLTESGRSRDEPAVARSARRTQRRRARRGRRSPRPAICAAAISGGRRRAGRCRDRERQRRLRAADPRRSPASGTASARAGPSVAYERLGAPTDEALVAAAASAASARSGPGQTRCWSAGTGVTVWTRVPRSRRTGQREHGRAGDQRRRRRRSPPHPPAARMLARATPRRSATVGSFPHAARSDDGLVEPVLERSWERTAEARATGSGVIGRHILLRGLDRCFARPVRRSYSDSVSLARRRVRLRGSSADSSGSSSGSHRLAFVLVRGHGAAGRSARTRGRPNDVVGIAISSAMPITMPWTSSTIVAPHPARAGRDQRGRRLCRGPAVEGPQPAACAVTPTGASSGLPSRAMARARRRSPRPSGVRPPSPPGPSPDGDSSTKSTPSALHRRRTVVAAREARLPARTASSCCRPRRATARSSSASSARRASDPLPRTSVAARPPSGCGVIRSVPTRGWVDAFAVTTAGMVRPSLVLDDRDAGRASPRPRGPRRSRA